MRLSLRPLWTSFAAITLFAGLVFAPSALAGYEGCASICNYSPPSRGCSCSSPYYNINCGIYAQEGCFGMRAPGGGFDLDDAQALPLQAQPMVDLGAACSEARETTQPEERVEPVSQR